MPPVLVFDVVGTLLDISALDPLFEQHLGKQELRKEWFSEVLKLALARTAIGAYSEFSRITEAALKVIARRYGKELDTNVSKEILSSLRRLPPFVDVKPALERCRKNGFHLATLTNSGQSAVTEALQNAQIAELFDRILSADSVKRLKPAAEPYQMAARELGIDIKSMIMVAAHSWDIAGAGTAGCQTAFIQRPYEVLDDLTPTPAIIASDLHDLAGKISHLQAA
jgi:2-haloalkanoic acid dehalogenase, type II